jgi:glycine cleavage system H protein
MKLDTSARYSESHEWVRPEGALFAYGITDHAQEELSDIVYVDLPVAGADFKKGEMVGTVESVKAASDIFLPMSGVIVEVNNALEASPDAINSDPYGAGWIVKFEASDLSEWDQLLTADAYERLAGA